MPDISHQFGNDLQLSATGDLLAVDGDAQTTQRVLRRLLTSPGDYIWQLAYGAGLPQMIGQVVNASRIAAIARAQMLQEPTVARAPAPNVQVSSDGTGGVFLYIRYTDATTGQTVGPLTVPVG